MKYRVDLNVIEGASQAYGGKLEAWSFLPHDSYEWFSEFRALLLGAIGKRYLPIYRMADGEYKFLMGRKFDIHRKPFLKEVISYLYEHIKYKKNSEWSTSWGEKYNYDDIKKLKLKLLNNIKTISEEGYLACFINNNGNNSYSEYNNIIIKYFNKNNIILTNKNYIPFHFVVGLLTMHGWAEFIKDRKILVVTGLSVEKKVSINRSLSLLGSHEVSFINISNQTSMLETIPINEIDENIGVDIVLVAAGIGSANIINQLKQLKTLVLDIGGYMNTLENPLNIQHGGIFKFPLK